MPGHVLTYGFDPTGGCGSAPAAGKNTNRTSLVDNGAATGYCYDDADKLTSTTDARYATPTYDDHGNTATLGNQTRTYDGADRHMATTVANSPAPGQTTNVRYTRDATDRIVERKEGVGAALPGPRYGYSGAGDTSDFTVTAEALITERQISLVGGVTLTKRPLAADVWSYPNIHGDVMSTANAARSQAGRHPHL